MALQTALRRAQAQDEARTLNNGEIAPMHPVSTIHQNPMRSPMVDPTQSGMTVPPPARSINESCDSSSSTAPCSPSTMTNPPNSVRRYTPPNSIPENFHNLPHGESSILF